MSEVFIDKIRDEVFVKIDGKVTQANVVGVKPTDDVVSELTQEQIDDKAFLLAERLLKNKIMDIKNKYELFSMGIIDQAEWDSKKDEYAPLKTDYDSKKEK